MWVAIELIIMPIMLIIVIIILGVIQSFGLGAIAVSAVVLTIIYALVRLLLRFLLSVEHDEGIQSWEEPEPAHDAMEAELPLVAAPEKDFDMIDECGDESFPASDPPSWTLGPTTP